MKHYFRKMPQANAVSAGGTSTFQIPLGPTYRSFELRYKASGADAPAATMAADITGIRVKINGISRIDITGAALITLLKYYGYTVDDGVLPLIFARTYARTVVGEENLAVGTRNLETLTIEVDIAGGATTPALALDAVYTPESRDLGWFIQILTNDFQAATAGQFEISTLPRTNGSLVGMHLFSGNITGLNVLLDSVEHFDADLVTQRSVIKRTGRVPQTSVQHIEPTFLDRFDDVWPLEAVQDFRVKVTMSGSGSVPIVMETLNVPIRSAA